GPSLGCPDINRPGDTNPTDALWGNEKPIASASTPHETALRSTRRAPSHAFAPAPCEASHGCDARNDDPYPRDLLVGDGWQAVAEEDLPDQLAAAADADLVEDGRQVLLDGVGRGRDPKRPRDLAGRAALEHQRGDRLLPVR